MLVKILPKYSSKDRVYEVCKDRRFEENNCYRVLIEGNESKYVIDRDRCRVLNWENPVEYIDYLQLREHRRQEEMKK